MKTGFAMLAGVGVLALAMGVSSATAATRHYHHRNVGNSHAMPAAAQAEDAGLATNGNNPAKKYPTRHMPDGAIKTSTLSTNGNNPAKAYAVRHAPENAMRESTLATNGNNPAKRYPSTASTTGAASR
jgi:hypothetical protein